VLPFTVAGRDTLLTPLGFGLAELLVTDLSVSSQLQMLDRLRIDAILRELALVDSGVTDPRAAPRVGRLMGARRLLIGSVRGRAASGEPDDRARCHHPGHPVKRHSIVATLLAALSAAVPAQESLLPSAAWGFGPIISAWHFSTPIATASGAIQEVAQAAVPF